MNRFSLYRKELEILKIVKERFDHCDYHSGFAYAIDELFFENGNNLRADFLEIVPVPKLQETISILLFLKTIYASTSDGRISSNYGSRSQQKAIAEIEELENMISEEANRRFSFRVFYSWQSDTRSTFNRNFIESCLESAVKRVNDNHSDSPLLCVDKDTRGVPGSPDIINTILQKIDNSICFVADITPVGIIGEKYIPNPNVMFELGYALSALGFERVILICNTAQCEIKDLPFDLGLKRVMTYRYSETTDVAERDECKKKLKETLVDAIETICKY